MLPMIWIFDSYSIMMLLGVIACFALFMLYAKKRKFEESFSMDVIICACMAIIIGIISAALAQIIFDLLKDISSIRFGAMTFYGGLIGGVIAFILIFRFWVQKKHNTKKLATDIVPIAPACITIAHAFGRIGCFLAGCCHGKETTSSLGMYFPAINAIVYPTQLYEALFLFILSAILFLLAYYKNLKYNMCIYLSSYSIFRFLIEFLRGDNRGFSLLALSPSQLLSIIALLISVGWFIVLKNKRNC